MTRREYTLGLTFFLLVAYPYIQTRTRLTGRGAMFRYRNQLDQAGK